MRTLRTLFAAALIAAVAGTAVSQPPGGGRGGMMGRGMNQMGAGMLLGNPSVQTELKLSDDQKEKLKKVQEAQREKMREAIEGMQEEGGREKMQAAMKEAGEAAEKAIKEILNADQQKRLTQIRYQQMGVMGIAADAELTKALKITDDQKTKFKELGEEMQKDMRELFQSGADRDEMRTKGEALRKEYAEKADGILTDEQKSEFKTLKGEPFELKIDPNARFGPGGKGGERKGKGGEKKKIDD